MDRELDTSTQEYLEALRLLRKCVCVLKKEYTLADIESFVGRAYGDPGKVIAPPANISPSQPSV
jgi:hypothetical protein